MRSAVFGVKPAARLVEAVLVMASCPTRQVAQACEGSSQGCLPDKPSRQAFHRTQRHQDGTYPISCMIPREAFPVVCLAGGMIWDLTAKGAAMSPHALLAEQSSA